MRTMLLTVLLMVAATPTVALELSAGKYKHTFDDGTCGTYSVNSIGKFTKYEYGPCGRKPTYVTKNIRVRDNTIKSGGVTIKNIKTNSRCFWGTWYWEQYAIPNKRFCR